MDKNLRIFISSPSDVNPERRRARLLVEKLAKEYIRFFSIEPILWELEPGSASGHFQDQIVLPAETDIFILIVWSRLGTQLPVETEGREYRGIDNRAPVTGTEWEFENALAAQQRQGKPHLLAYRKVAEPTVSLADFAKKKEAENQWDRLEEFWKKWFVDHAQIYKAFGYFQGLDDFEAKIESDLRKLIDNEAKLALASNGAQRTGSWLTGSPFRGLESYKFEHSAIFFGRDEIIKSAVERLGDNAEQGLAFLLVLGASGSGKSSLAQAGVLPSLTGRGIVPGVGIWRRATMRPASLSGKPFQALAEALVSEHALPQPASIGPDGSTR